MESDQLLLTISVGVCPNYWRSDMSLLRLPDTSGRLKFGVLCTGLLPLTVNSSVLATIMQGFQER